MTSAANGPTLLIATRKGLWFLDGAPDRASWTLTGPQFLGGDKDGTPDGPKVHSVIVDPRDANHLYISMSGGGTFESTDAGGNWHPLNKGVLVTFGPESYPEFSQDPHCVRMHPLQPDRLFQQNHCGVYRLDRPARKWVRIGDNMPKSIGDVGFPMVVHPRNADIAWVMPMNGTTVWPRTAPQGKPAVYITRNAGAKWQRQDTGMPRSQAWWTVKRQAMTNDTQGAVGLYFGTTSGDLWLSRDEGQRWACIARHLPEIYSLEVAER